MPRVVFGHGKQRAFLEAAKTALGGHGEALAACCGVHPRTIRDWQREKYLISEAAMLALQKASGITSPPYLEVRSDYWSTSKAGRCGAQRRFEKYGNPGTSEGRRRGGTVSYERFRRHGAPAGFRMRAKIRRPRRSPTLAEFIGIMLGDGGISDHQITITLNADTDKDYAEFIAKMVSQLFGLVPSRKTRGNAHVLAVSSMAMLEFLKERGLVQGNKVRQQASVPCWISNNTRYSKACLRGLMDTDGSVYWYTHTVGQTRYRHACVCFTNYSQPLTLSVNRILTASGFHTSYTQRRVFLYRQKEISRYFNEIGTHNPKHMKRYYAEARPLAVS